MIKIAKLIDDMFVMEKQADYSGIENGKGYWESPGDDGIVSDLYYTYC